MPVSLKYICAKYICAWISILPTTRTLLQRGDSNLKSKQKVFEWNQKNMYAVFRFPGIVVQLVRAPPCQGGSCGFEPRQSRTRVQWMDKFIFSFFMEIFDEKRGGGDRRQDQISMGHPYFTFLFLHFSVKRDQCSIEFFFTTSGW